MEEQKNNQIFMLSDTLTENFNQEQWRIISSQTPQAFLKKQQSILNRLLDQKDMFQKYFHNFYSNHIKLLDWSLLAGQLKYQINPYIFRTLVSKGSNFFNKKIKQVFEIKLKRKKKEKQQQINKQQIKQMEQQVYKQFFNDMVARTTPDNSQKYSNLKGLLNKKQTDKMDGHQFYIKTFNACNGWKYIFYNYQKHMKGLSQKFKYNQKIRSNQHKYLFYSKSQDNLHLLQYQHDNFIKVETKVHHINQILRDKKLNTMFGFKSLAKNSRKRKIFFQNHQGKPITYRVSRQ